MFGRFVTMHFMYHPSYSMKRQKSARNEYVEYIAQIVRAANA